MKTAISLLAQAGLISSFALAGCSPAPEMDTAKDIAETSAAQPRQDKAADKNKASVFVTISCHRGNLPGQNVSIMPIKAKIMIADEAYAEVFTERLMYNLKNDIDEDLELEAMGNENGHASIALLTDGKVRAAILPDDERLVMVPNNLSNYEWARLDLQNGKTAKFNYVMAQAYCDKNQGIRSIDPISYNIQIMGFSTDYGSTTSAGFGVDKQFYARANSGGAFKFYPNYGTNLNGDKSGVYMDEQISSMLINNVQSKKRIKRVCGTRADSLDVTIKTDGALGIKSYSGTIGGNAVQCEESYLTHYPFTYVRAGDDVNHTASERYLRHVDSHNTKQRSNCPADKLAKIDSPSISYPRACLESAIIHTNVFEAAPSSGVFPWGKLHKFSHRFDLTKPEEVKGKVPPTLLE